MSRVGLCAALIAVVGCSQLPSAEPDAGAIGTSKGAIVSLCDVETWNGHSYRFCYLPLLSWSDALKYCESKGEYLVSIGGQAENEFVRSHMPTGSWLGASDVDAEGDWKWVRSGLSFWLGNGSGQTVNGRYANWDLFQPDNFVNEDCAFLNPLSGKWNDLGCDVPYKFACEADFDYCPDDADKTSPGVCGCGESDTDTDGDGVADCADECPLDPTKSTSGDCGCLNAPAPGGTPCDDGVCEGSFSCNGFGVCGNPSTCAPDTNCAHVTVDGHAYWYCANARDWATARDNCRSRGLELASISDEAENSALTSKLMFPAWLGGNDRDQEGWWRWSSAPFDGGSVFWIGNANGKTSPGFAAFWKVAQPSSANPDDCLSVAPLDLGRWSARPCTEVRGFVCEVPPDLCPEDPNKRVPGICGCGVSDQDSDSDGTPDCKDACPHDPLRLTPGTCGCVGNPDPASAGTSCNDGICSANTTCDGQGRCGTLAQCAPDTNCSTLVRDRRVYWLCRNDRNWQAASNRCLTVPRTTLARIDRATENDLLSNHIVADSWIGASDSATEGQWRWQGTNTLFWQGVAAGQPVGGLYNAWSVGQPDNFINEDCALLSRVTRQWSDLGCAFLMDFVCETCIPRMCSDVGAECGFIDDGCGGTVDCGAQTGGCSAPEICFPVANRCANPGDVRECQSELVMDATLPPQQARRQFLTRYIGCTDPSVDTCVAQFRAAVRDDRAIASQYCGSDLITPSQHNTVNFDRAAKDETAMADPTYACRVVAADIDRDLVPDDIDQCLDTPPLTATLPNGCPTAVVVPGPDREHMARYREATVLMHDPDCDGMDMKHTPRDVKFLTKTTLTFRPFQSPPGCDVLYEFQGSGRLTNGQRTSYHFIFTKEDAADFHLLRYLFLMPGDPGDRGRLATDELVELIYTFRAINGSGSSSYWTHPARAGREPQ